MSKIKLSELGTFKNGLNYNSGNITNGGCKIVGIPDFADRYIADLRCLSEVDSAIVSDDYLLKKDDILFVRSNGNKALVGRTMIIGEIRDRITYSGFCIRFRPDSDKVIPLFLLYLFKSSQFRKHFSRSQQTSINNLNQDTLGSIILDLPDIHAQEMIVKCIHSITQKIETNKAINDNLQHQLKLLYDYWFTQFDFPDENGKPYRASGGAMVWNEQLRKEIPKDWSVTTVGDITVCHDSKRIPVSNVEREKMKGNIPYYGATGIMGYVNRAIFSGDYVLLAEDGSVMDKNGNPIIQRVSGDVWINNHAHVLQPTGKYSCRLLMMILKDIPVTNIKTGSIQLKINQKNLNSYKILNIPNNIIEKINQVFIPIDQQLIAIQKEVEYLSALRDWLLPMLMNGQATISG